MEGLSSSNVRLETASDEYENKGFCEVYAGRIKGESEIPPAK